MAFHSLQSKPLRPPCRWLGTFVAIDLDRLSVKLEAAISDTVAIAAAGCSEIGVGCDIGRDVVEAQHDVGQRSIPARQLEAGEPRAIADEPWLIRPLPLRSTKPSTSLPFSLPNVNRSIFIAPSRFLKSNQLCCKISSAQRLPIIIAGALVLPALMFGMAERSHTRKPFDADHPQARIQHRHGIARRPHAAGAAWMVVGLDEALAMGAQRVITRIRGIGNGDLPEAASQRSPCGWP